MLESVTFALTFMVLTYLFLAEPMIVQGASSYPNLQTGERIIVDKITPHWQPYERGEFVIPEAPGHPDTTYIKRIVGLSGEKISISQCRVSIDDKILAEPYLDKDICTTGGQFLEEYDDLIIPPDSYFLMGDNRAHSSDSRDFGAVSKDKIIGRAWLRFWPPEKVGRLE